MSCSLRFNNQWLREKYYQDKWTLQKIADYCNCAPSTIFRWFKEEGIKTRTHKEAAQFFTGYNNQACQPGIGQKISQAKKGKKFTETHKIALAKSWKRTRQKRIEAIKKTLSKPEVREAIRQGQLGRKASPELCQKLSEVHKGLQAGEKHPNWRGGISSAYRNSLTDRSWHELRKQIYERDNWTCQDCDKKCHSDISCHHLIPYRVSKDDSPENLIILCTSCHTKREWSIQKDFYQDSDKEDFAIISLA